VPLSDRFASPRAVTTLLVPTSRPMRVRVVLVPTLLPAAAVLFSEL
jgi:hypothetical protein